MSYRRVLETVGALLLVAGSFAGASRVVFAALTRSARTDTPDQFAVVAMVSPDQIALLRFRSPQADSVQDPVLTYLIPSDRVAHFNAALSEQYTGHGGRWRFEVITNDTLRQYIHVTTSGESVITDSWYWATANAVEPDRFREVTRSALVLVVPLAAFFTACGALAYVLIRRRIAPAWRAN